MDTREPAFTRASSRLASALERLADESNRDRGRLAALRRGLGESDGWHPAVAMVVDPVIGDMNLYPSQLDALYMAASLFALHPYTRARVEGRRHQTLLDALNDVMAMRGGDEARKPFDRRVIALLNTNREDLFHHLRYTVSLLRGTEIGIDWVRLMRDIDAWSSPERKVQRAWARSWWSSPGWIGQDQRTADTSSTLRAGARDPVSPVLPGESYPEGELT
jgi:CRISPR system Cascade subunit CasB